MKLNRIQKLPLLIGVLATILLITNPSIKSFEDYLGLQPIVRQAVMLRKERNFIFCSIYSESLKGKRYFGILSNFYQIDSLTRDIPKSTGKNSNLDN